jgi:hypothetical protein
VAHLVADAVGAAALLKEINHHDLRNRKWLPDRRIEFRRMPVCTRWGGRCQERINLIWDWGYGLGLCHIMY